MEVAQDEVKVEAAPIPPMLGFERMDEMMDAFHEATKGTVAGRVERSLLYLGLFGATVALVAIAFDARVLTLVGFIVEVAGLSISVGLTLKREWRGIKHAKRTYSKELDLDFGKYSEYVQQLRTYSRRDRDRHFRYIKARREVMRYRMGLVTGGVERLGVLPLIAALYLQLKDWQFGNWDAFGEITLVQAMLAWFFLLLYAGSWHLIRLYSRIEAYEQLLTEAAARDAEAADNAA